jgi:regulator of protease activity HflC (stomatin/prohibitin superfamily)
MPRREVTVRETHCALWYEDGKFTRLLEPGRYLLPSEPWFGRGKRVEVLMVDMRERELTIKGQEILTADKVSLRVSILVQFRVSDAKAALHEVENYEERLYSDVQLAARRSLASMTLDEMLTNRNQLSEQILADVKETAAGYGVGIRRADVKDLIFPGNLQEIMNQVLAAQRQSEAKLVQARTQAEVERIQAETQAQIRRTSAAAETEAERLRHEMERENARQSAETDAQVFAQRQQAAELLEQYPTLVRLLELEAMRELAKNSNARVYVGFDRPTGESIRVHD